jgi:phosphatidylcholine synthase
MVLSPSTRAAAFAVHVYTATGVVLGLLMVHFAYEGSTSVVLWLFLVAMVVDGSDGLLARRYRVKEAWPQFDGALLDNIVDYLTYAFAPIVFLLAGGFLPSGWVGWVCAATPLMASGYQFCRADAKTDDHCFLGFPSYWNVVAFYVVVLGLGPTATAWVLLAFALLVFVPIRYVYPSRTETLWGLNMTLTALWFVAYAVITAQLPDASTWVVAASVAYVAYYVGLSLWLTLGRSRSRGSVPAAVPVGE